MHGPFLARELSAAEIARIREQSALELELFVHGALCMSVSGQCLMSAMLGGRSGNRGLCAQPCRLAYTAGGREHALSLKDLSLIPHIRQLQALGVRSLKIEGRMKRPECGRRRARLPDGARRRRAGHGRAARRILRSGFTDGYFTARRTPDMFGYRTKEDVLRAKPVLSGLSELYRKERPRVGVAMRFTAQNGAPCALEADDGTRRVRAEGPVPAPAQSRALDRETAARSLQKCGDTPYFLERLDTRIDGGLFLPVSALNRLRGQVLDALTEQRAKPPARIAGPCRRRSIRRRTRKSVRPARLARRSRTAHPGADERRRNHLLPLGAVPADGEWIRSFAGRLAVRIRT